MLRNVFARKNRQPKLKKRRQLTFESLEERQMFAGITYDPDTQIIEINGTDGRDTAVVEEVSPIHFRVRLHTPTQTFETETFYWQDVDLVRFYGHDGDDRFTNHGLVKAYANGGGGSDFLTGGEMDDTLVGGGGPGDVFVGNAGNDLLVGGAGEDFMLGGEGDDLIFGNGGDDRVMAGAGNDVVYAGEGDDLVQGDAGDDVLLGEGGDDTLHGDEDDDDLYGGPGDDNLYGGAHRDRLWGEGGNDGLFGGGLSGPHSDQLRGGAGSDRFLMQGGDVALDAVGDDVRMWFYDTTVAQDIFGTTWSTQMWTDAEIEQVDKALGFVHRAMGNTAMLRHQGTPFTFQRIGTPADPDVNYSGFNHGNSYISIADTGFSSESWTQQLVYHEIGHSFENELPSTWKRFLSLSGWQEATSNTVPAGKLMSLNGNWWYDVGTPFARSYGRTNPKEDFATAFAAYWMEASGGFYQTDLSDDISAKISIIYDAVSGLSSLPVYNPNVSIVPPFTPIVQPPVFLDLPINLPAQDLLQPALASHPTNALEAPAPIRASALSPMHEPPVHELHKADSNSRLRISAKQHTAVDSVMRGLLDDVLAPVAVARK